MTNADRIRLRLWLAGSLMALLSVAVAFADRRGVLSPVRTALMDVLNPGRLILLSVAGNGDDTSRQNRPATSNSAADKLQLALRESEIQRRQLIIQNADLRQELKQRSTLEEISHRLPAGGYRFQIPESKKSLTEFTAIRASVISNHQMAERLKELMIDAGKAAGVTRAELVVDGVGILLDQGKERNIQNGDRVVAGAAVVGRISKTGRWVSLVQPLTDSGFSAGIQLVRSTSEGQHFGATGILRGTGEKHCVIEGVPYTEAVSVGDDVVSSEIDGVNGPRLYFGRVSEVQFLDGGQWLIRAEPAVRMSELQHVGILRLQLNIPSRESLPAASQEPRHHKEVAR